MAERVIEKQEFTAPSSDGIHTLRGVVFCPVGERRGFFHVVHGMTEHMARYETFMRDMAAEGWLCFGYDNLGHGRTADSVEELGFIAHKGGWELLVRDVKAFSDAVFAAYGRTDEPYCLMGHSMGSFIVRLAAGGTVQPDRLIAMGTGGPNPASGLGIALTEAVKLLRGERHISKLIDRLVFGNYNQRFAQKGKPSGGLWLTTDSSVIEKYRHDPYCTFKFTVSAMGDLIRLNRYANRASLYRSLPRTLPVLLVSGAEDPVGAYGKGILRVRDGLQKRGIEVRCVLYPGARHEILNDFTYETVKGDILDFCVPRT